MQTLVSTCNCRLQYSVFSGSPFPVLLTQEVIREGEGGGLNDQESPERKQPLMIFVEKPTSYLTIVDYIYTKNELRALKFKAYRQMQFSLPLIKCSVAPPSFCLCCLNCAKGFDLIAVQSTVVTTCKESSNN